MNVGSSSQIQFCERRQFSAKNVSRRFSVYSVGSIVLFLYVQCIICTFTKGKIPIFKPSLLLYKLVEKEYSKRNIPDNLHAT